MAKHKKAMLHASFPAVRSFIAPKSPALMGALSLGPARTERG